MTRVRKAVTAAAMVGSTLAGGALGAYLFAGGTANAATTTTPPAVSGSPGTSGNATTPAPPGGAGYGVGSDGKFHSNENATHEAGESAAREAQENAGQVPTVP
jgi:hypothetical protein